MDRKIIDLIKSKDRANAALAKQLLMSVYKYTEAAANEEVDSTISELIGEKILMIKRDKYQGNDCLKFYLTEDSGYMFYHSQDCCESVYIDDINGDLNDLIGETLLVAKETVNSGENGKWGDTETWTFYKFASVKGYVDIKWYGTSNGYYSESVDFTTFKD